MDIYLCAVYDNGELYIYNTFGISLYDGFRNMIEEFLMEDAFKGEYTDADGKINVEDATWYLRTSKSIEFGEMYNINDFK